MCAQFTADSGPRPHGFLTVHPLAHRLHATGDQLRRAYPGWDAAMAAKSRIDPHPVFRNTLFDTYRPRS